MKLVESSLGSFPRTLRYRLELVPVKEVVGGNPRWNRSSRNQCVKLGLRRRL
jgi:hypothetical protein